ncbi:MAG: VOC family protein [Acidobacteria bacterium]|nr:VOC family protein [Acidobacteriota bacterium]MBI3428169.1 VOC family protein [Acidobacteriota bacterium]
MNNAKLMGFAAITDAARARAFYEEQLGLKFVADDGYALVFETGGNLLRLQKMKAHTPLPFTVLGWQITDIHATIRELTGKGVTFERYDFMQQDEWGVWESGGDKVAWFKDPDGNLLSLAQLKA